MKRVIITFLCLLCIVQAYSQSFTISGTIIDGESNEPLIGAGILVKGAGRGTITNIDGKYSLEVKRGETLVFSFVGYQNQEVAITNQRTLNIALRVSEANNLNEVVITGRGSAKRITLTGAVSGIQANELRRVPTSSLQNTLSGKLPGFFSQQRSGQPGKDASDFFIRGVSSLNEDGNKPLIMVDDVEYSYEQLSQINVNEIESISILKDASTTAIYGIKGANGVLVVKTRRGEEGKPVIHVRAEAGGQIPVRKPNFLDSYNTALLVNEARTNDGLTKMFTQHDLELFKDGSDPYGHPNVNWYDEVFKKSAMQSNINVDVSGGTKRLKYFVSGGYFSQGGLVRNFAKADDDVNTGYFYRRFDYRTNLDFTVTDNLTMRLDFSSRFMNINEPSSLNATGEIYNFTAMHPYSAPVLNPDGSYAYLSDVDGYGPTLNARLANEGYTRTRRNDNNILYGVNWKMDWLTKGLSANARIAYSTIDEVFRKVNRGKDAYPTYHYDPTTDQYNINPNRKYAYSQYALTAGTNQAVKNLDVQASINYARVFNEIHDVSATLLYSRQSRTVEKNPDDTGEKIPENFQGLTATVGYKYKDKYLVDFNVAYNGTDRFAEGHRYGIFPAIGVGWRISEESFFKDNISFIQLLKIRASYGIVGSDVAMGNRYLYNQIYTATDNAYNFGQSDVTSTAITEGDLGNSSVTWEEAKKFDIGLDFNAFDRFSFTFDWFYDRRYNQLVKRNDIPQILGVGTSPINVARTSNMGFDGQIGYQDRFGEFNFNTNFVFSYAKNKVEFNAEAQQRYDWLSATGRPIGQPFGYTWIGYYTPEEVDLIHAGAANAPAVPNTDVPIQAGDLKYKDLNGDGVINDFDKGAIGKPNLPNTTLGWTIGGSWKGLSVSVLFQGSFNYSFSVNGTGIEPFKSQFQPLHQKRWTLERYLNGEAIEFPRLTSNPSTVNSAAAYMSDFWLIDAWYIRLKTIDVSYQVPTKVLPSWLTNLRVYLNAYNMFTWTSFDKYQQDPEIKSNSAGDAYMNQRVFNLGVQLTF